MATLTPIKYKQETLSIINSLALIGEKIRIKKEKKNILIAKANGSESIIYKFSAPSEFFDFVGDELAFHNFSEFFALQTVFSKPEIKQNSDKLYILSGNSRISYVVSDPDTISEFAGKINFSQPDFEVNIEKDVLKEIEKMKGILNAEKSKLTIKGDKINIGILADVYDNSFDKSLKGTNNTKEDFSYIISSEIFNVLPKADYKLEIKKEGIVRFTLKDEKINLEIFVAEVSEE